MKIRVLGCSGSIAAGSRTTSFLIGDSVLVDAGTGVGDLTLEEMARIDHVLISHSHLDHILAIPLLADSVMRLRSAAGRAPILVHALPQTIAALRTHVFNGVIWPDFTALPSVERPVLAFQPFAVGDVLPLAGRRFEVMPAEHTVPAVGFALLGSGDATGRETVDWVFTGDTGPNPALWQRLRGTEVRHIVIETAFGNDESAIAAISRHLSPATLGGELAQLDGNVAVHITHIKPGEIAQVMTQVRGLGTAHQLHALHTGQVIDLG